jgi:hypothetical protein
LSDYLGDRTGIDFISADGELKEAMLRVDEPEPGPTQRAVMLLKGVFHVVDTRPEATAPLDRPRGWLVEPDPAIIRAGAVAQVAAELGGALLESDIAYFTTADRPETPTVKAWRIRESMPFNVKALRARLRDLGVGHVTVKKRGTAVTPETLIPQLKLKGEGSCTIVLTRNLGEMVSLICEDLVGVKVASPEGER